MAVLGSQTGQSDFADESAVVSRALYLLEERKKLVHLRKLLAEAEAEIERGEYTVWRPGMMAELLELGRQRARDGIAPNPDVIEALQVNYFSAGKIGHCRYRLLDRA
jgi:hypothetical protein